MVSLIMKKNFLFCFILLLFSSKIFSRDFYVICSRKYDEQSEIFFTQPIRSSQYSIIIAKKKNQKYEALYIFSFHSYSDNETMYYLARDCYENIDLFIKTHPLEKGSFFNNALIFQDTKKYSFVPSFPLGYNDFRK